MEDGSFGEGFPYGDLGETICIGRVDDSGVIRWVEVCYCREYYGVAMHEELPYLEEYLTDIEVADARSPRYCKGYPECNECACTRKVPLEGEPLLDYLRHTAGSPSDANTGVGKSTRWLGWPGRSCRRKLGETEKATRIDRLPGCPLVDQAITSSVLVLTSRRT